MSSLYPSRRRDQYLLVHRLPSGTLRNTLALPLNYTHPAVTPDGQQLWVPGQHGAISSSAGNVGVDLKTGKSGVIYTFSDGYLAFAPLAPADTQSSY